MSTDQHTIYRRTFEISKKANDNLKDLPKKIGITQFEMVSLLLEHVREDDIFLQQAATAIKARKLQVKLAQKMIKGKTPTEIAKILAENPNIEENLLP
tara:strand:+ start:55285 stop:55578 length:294 start_codon:yes stop_codon:yes gene_type:complete